MKRNNSLANSYTAYREHLLVVFEQRKESLEQSLKEISIADLAERMDEAQEIVFNAWQELLAVDRFLLGEGDAGMYVRHFCKSVELFYLFLTGKLNVDELIDEIS